MARPKKTKEEIQELFTKKSPSKETKMSVEQMLEVVEKMKEAGVHSFSIDGLSVNMIPEVVYEAYKKKNTVPEITETDEERRIRIQKEEEDDLYHSAN